MEPLSEYFDKDRREVAVANAIKDGYSQMAIGKYLGLSKTAVSKAECNACQSFF